MTIKALISILMLLAGVASQAQETFRNTKFVLEHKHDSSRGWLLPSGQFVKAPLLIYNADLSIVMGLADLNQAKSLVGNSSFQPATVVKDGVPYAIVRLYFVKYLDTDVGPYQEFILSFDSNDSVIPIPYVNPYSILVPASLPGNRLFLSHLILNKQSPIDLGIQAWGLNKKRGYLKNQSRTRAESTTKSVEVKDGSAQVIVRGSFLVDKSQKAGVDFVTGLLAATGLTQLPLPPEVNFISQVNSHIKTGQDSLTDSFYTWKPSFNLYQGRLKFGSRSGLATLLTKLDFVPLLTVHTDEMQFTFDDPQISK